MHLYLVQHGEAKREEEDAERPLTDRGREDITRVARFAAEHGRVPVTRILHSGKTRARQSAEILAEHLRPPEGFEAREGIAPQDDPETISRILGDSSEDLMIVGHLPHLERLAGLLLCGDAGRSPVRFTMAGITALTRDERGAWSVEWIVTPNVLPS